MQALVTGAAGFIGSHLADRLVAEGWDVVGADCFTPYYDREVKQANLVELADHDRFRLVEVDLADDDLAPLVAGADAVFHLAAQPGVRLSWADGFAAYERNNVLLTQRLLEAVAAAPARPALVFASSSSVYGEKAQSPSREDDALRPHNPYGVTKVAAELLIDAYVAHFGVHAVMLRLFSVYGPRQRPDLALHRIIQSALDEATPFPLYGDGSNGRDFTYVGDVVDACWRAAIEPLAAGTVLNVAGGETATVAELIDEVAAILGRPVPVHRHPAAAGDVTNTAGSTDRIASVLGWRPQVTLRDGIERQVDWHLARAGLTR